MLAIGGCTIAELQDRMSYTEFWEWVAFAEVEPLPEQRADLRNARQMALLANVHRDAKQRANAYAPREFLVDWWQVTPAANDVHAKFRAMAARINAQNEVTNAA